MTYFKPKISARSGVISRIVNVGGFYLKDILRVAIVFSGIVFTSSLDRLNLLRYDIVRRFYLWTYFLGKRITDSKNVRLFQQYIQPGAVVLDVGAAFGFYSLISSKLAGVNGRVFAFEPDPMYTVFLKDLVKGGKISNVKVIPYAAWSEQTKLALHIRPGNPGENSLFRGSIHSKSVSVHAVTLDQYLDLPYVDFVKIDTQGAEYNIIQGMRKLIEKSPNIILLIECNPANLGSAGTNIKQLLDLLSDLQLKVFTCDTSPPTQILRSSDLDYVYRKIKYVECDLICMR